MSRPRRVSVVGNSGSGKSRLAALIAECLRVSWVELDAIFHQPDWTPLPTDEFRDRVDTLTAKDSWVVDGNYGQVSDLVWKRADTVVWLDLPRTQVVRQVASRTLLRALTRKELWNTNREPLSNLWRWNAEDSIIRWAWTQHAVCRERYGAAMDDPRWCHLEFVRLQSHADARRWLETLTA